MVVKYPITLSVSEPNNNIGLLKVRQADEESQTLVVQILEDAVPKSYEGLQVFFCARIGQTAGLGIIEQKLNVSEMTEPKNGKLEYTFRVEDWQILGRQTGYFSFRKMKDDHTYEQQFSTRDFTYEITKNIYSDGIKEVTKDGSTYVWTFEDLLRLLEEFKESGETDFIVWFNEIKDQLSEDAAGNLMILYQSLRDKTGKDTDFRDFESDLSFMKRVYNENKERALNVKWYGVVGDGETDDTAAIQAAIDDMDDYTQLVFEPKMTYKIRSILIDKPHTRFDGMNSRFNVQNVENRGFVLAADDILIENFYCEVDYEIPSGDNTYHNDYFIHGKTNNSTFRNNNVTGLGLVHLRGSGTGNKIIQNTANSGTTPDKLTSDRLAYGIRMEKAAGFIISGNTLDSYGIDGIKLVKSPTDVDAYSQTGIISENFIKNMKNDDGIDVYDNATRIIIANNVIENCGKGINCKVERVNNEFNVSKNLILGNIVRGVEYNKSTLQLQNGIVVNCQGVVLANNIIYDIEGTGILLREDASDCIVSNNSVTNITKGTSTNSNSGKGILVYSDAKRINTSNNYVADCEVYGIETQSGNVKFIGDMIHNPGTRGMQINPIGNMNGINLVGIKITADKTVERGIQVTSNATIPVIIGDSSVIGDFAYKLRDDTNNVLQSNNSWNGKKYGTTTDRPVDKFIGQEYYDTTIRKPIWWNGAGWRDATDTPV